MCAFARLIPFRSIAFSQSALVLLVCLSDELSSTRRLLCEFLSGGQVSQPVFIRVRSIPA